MEIPEQPLPDPQIEHLQSRKEEWRFCDPESDGDRKGMLLSDQIDKFCKEGLLIATNYDRSRLRPAAYTLTIGNHYVDSSGKIGSLSKENPFLEMKENSIVYVTTTEQLDLPHYIVARFNLRVKWVYKGILLGTGPQVEPGYRGFLSCPLYNLTNRPIRTRLGEEFATIDFERTTNFCSGKNSSEIKAAIKKGEKLDEVTVDDRTYLLFKDKGYKPLQHLPDYDIVLSCGNAKGSTELEKHRHRCRHRVRELGVEHHGLTGSNGGKRHQQCEGCLQAPSRIATSTRQDNVLAKLHRFLEPTTPTSAPPIPRNPTKE